MASSTHQLLCLGPHGFHRTIYRQWGDPNNRNHLVCVHGLTRNSHDFDRFATALQHDYLVTCPDVVGRGRSDWLSVKADYGYPQYKSDMATLVARLDTGTLDWVGTSMGGILGMMLAAQPNSPIRKLVLNDIGAVIPKGLITRILSYLGQPQRFETLREAERYLRELYVGFGPLNDEQWLEVAANSTYQHSDGSYGLAYDPGIAEPFRSMEANEDILMWDLWDAIRCPVLVLRGVESDALTAETAAEMQRRGPTAALMEVEKTGHTPPLMDPEQIEHVRRWLLD